MNDETLSETVCKTKRFFGHHRESPKYRNLCIFHKDWDLNAHKIQLTQKLQPANHR